MTPKKLVIVLPHLGAGGSQKVGIWLAKRWLTEGCETTLVTLFPHEKQVYSCPDSLRWIKLPRQNAGNKRPSRTYQGALGIVRRIALAQKARTPQLYEYARGALRVLSYATPRARAMASVTRRNKDLRKTLVDLAPDAVLALGASVAVISVAASRGLPIRVVVSERNNPAQQKLKYPYHRLRPAAYAEAFAVTVNSLSAAKTIGSWKQGIEPVYIPNPAPSSPPQVVGVQRRDRFVCLGRLVPQKHQRLLLKSFARLPDSLGHWHLDLIGDGPDRQHLERMAHSLSIASRVHFHGHVSPPHELLAQSSVFVQPSAFEGMSNALLEAMALGLPCAVSAACTGDGLIVDEETGLISKTGSAPDLAEKMARLASDSELRNQLGQAARDRLAALDEDTIFAQWQEVLAPVKSDESPRADSAS